MVDAFFLTIYSTLNVSNESPIIIKQIVNQVYAEQKLNTRLMNNAKCSLILQRINEHTEVHRLLKECQKQSVANCISDALIKS